ncbi:ARID/BRIGHT DNA-binding domain-containing protein [Parasponia andersonii]|uniref:ARID/BRIGHT DNA-binding domain-containing protein n=1 Tax=Parasponia andersonii TaxID=3476 RepID=A0A2P5BMM6_PARAD|nr:ARID/BRIGHT DNA-binding domain-containing protein [Parasponia andersonii]
MSDSKEKDDVGQQAPVDALENEPQVEQSQAQAQAQAPVAETEIEAPTASDNIIITTNPDSVLLEPTQDSLPTSNPLDEQHRFVKPDTEAPIDVKNETQTDDLQAQEQDGNTTVSATPLPIPDSAVELITEASQLLRPEMADMEHPHTATHDEPVLPLSESSDMKPVPENAVDGEENKNSVDEKCIPEPSDNGNPTLKHSFLLDDHMYEGNESGTEEDQSNFMKELENFFRERSMEFKPPKFYGEGLNCLKLWRAVTRLGGYDKVTSCKLWRQVGESFKPPKTCTTVSWTFRGFYEKALLDYERHKIRGGELSVPVSSHSEPINVDTQASGSGRARRDAAARAMQGWHSQRLLGNGEVSDPIIKDKNSLSLQKREKQLKNIGSFKRKKPPYPDHVVKAARTKASKSQLDTAVVDVGPPAEWVKINVQRTKDCYEVYALVPGLLREEVRVQSDPSGRLVISGEPEHPDNPWGVTPFKKVVSLPSRIDPHQTSAVVTLHGQLFVRVPFEQSE